MWELVHKVGLTLHHGYFKSKHPLTITFDIYIEMSKTH